MLLGCVLGTAMCGDTGRRCQRFCSSHGSMRWAGQVGAQCSSVVICRSSPSQKAAIVRMMSEYEMRQVWRACRYTHVLLVCRLNF